MGRIGETGKQKSADGALAPRIRKRQIGTRLDFSILNLILYLESPGDGDGSCICLIEGKQLPDPTAMLVRGTLYPNTKSTMELPWAGVVYLESRDGWKKAADGPYTAGVRSIFCNTNSHFSRGSAANKEGLSRSWLFLFVEDRVPLQTQGPASPVRSMLRQ
jgi:hypothetical protein